MILERECNGKLIIIYSLPSFFQKGFEAKCYIDKISDSTDGRGQSFLGGDFSGQREQGLLLDHPWLKIYPESPFPYVVPVSTASSLPLPLNVPNLQVVQVFFYPLSFFFNFFTQPVAAARWWGPGGWQQLFVCMGSL